MKENHIESLLITSISGVTYLRLMISAVGFIWKTAENDDHFRMKKKEQLRLQ
jgi:hypothetical protein